MSEPIYIAKSSGLGTDLAEGLNFISNQTKHYKNEIKSN